MHDNLPPGVTDSMIPGNRPEDAAWEKFHEMIDADAELLSLTSEEATNVWKDGVIALLEKNK